MTDPNPFGIPKASRPDWFRAQLDEADPDTGEVYVYDVIDPYWGANAQDFANSLAALGDITQLNVYVNSPGGSVWEALAMRAALARHPANVTAYVDGIAASAASFLITGANEIVMSANSEVMIHDASNYAYGNAASMRANADKLDRTSTNIAQMYADRAGGDVADWRALMLAETWYSDTEAVAAGLADRVAEVPKRPAPVESEDEAIDSFDLSMFAHAGRAAAPDPLSPKAVATARRKLVSERHISPAEADAMISASMLERRGSRPAEPGTTTITDKEERVDHMTDAIIKGLKARLGIKPEQNMTEEQLLSAVDEVLAEQASGTAVAEGTVVLDSAAFAALQADAAAGRSAHDSLTSTRRDTVVDSAINAGKIPVARREHYRALLEADEEGTTAMLTKLAEGVVVNVKPTGYTGGVDESSDDDTLYNTFYATSATDKTEEV